jgi:hypothetical protein
MRTAITELNPLPDVDILASTDGTIAKDDLMIFDSSAVFGFSGYDIGANRKDRSKPVVTVVDCFNLGQVTMGMLPASPEHHVPQDTVAIVKLGGDGRYLAVVADGVSLNSKYEFSEDSGLAAHFVAPLFAEIDGGLLANNAPGLDSENIGEWLQRGSRFLNRRLVNDGRSNNKTDGQVALQIALIEKNHRKGVSNNYYQVSYASFGEAGSARYASQKQDSVSSLGVNKVSGGNRPFYRDLEASSPSVNIAKIEARSGDTLTFSTDGMLDEENSHLARTFSDPDVLAESNFKEQVSIVDDSLKSQRTKGRKDDISFMNILLN